MGASKSRRDKHWSGIRKPKDGMNSAQRRAALKKAGKRQEMEATILKNKEHHQKDRWLHAQVQSAEVFYQPIKLYFEYCIARNQKDFPESVRRDVDKILFVEPPELAVALERLQVERAQVKTRVGAKPNEYVDDWLGGGKRPPWKKDWTWWRTLSTMSKEFRQTFFGEKVVGWDASGLPIYAAVDEEFMAPDDGPDFLGEAIQGAMRAHQAGQGVLEEADTLVDGEAEVQAISSIPVVEERMAMLGIAYSQCPKK